jgi:hypothetical protein
MADPRHAEAVETSAAGDEGSGLPIVAPPGASPAVASSPYRELDPVHHAYEANPAPWWIALMWIVFLVGGAVYLVVNLTR